MADNIYTIKKGEKYPVLVKVNNFDEDKPIDLSDAEIRVQIKDELKDLCPIIEKKITKDSDPYYTGRILNPTRGEFTIIFNDEDYETLTVERIYYMTIFHDIPDKNFSKVISSNSDEKLLFKVCIP